MSKAFHYARQCARFYRTATGLLVLVLVTLIFAIEPAMLWMQTGAVQSVAASAIQFVGVLLLVSYLTVRLHHDAEQRVTVSRQAQDAKSVELKEQLERRLEELRELVIGVAPSERLDALAAEVERLSSVVADLGKQGHEIDEQFHRVGKRILQLREAMAAQVNNEQSAV